MPIYEYKCETCGHQFDRMKKMSDPNPSCPALSGPVGSSWLQWFAENREKLEKGEKVECPGHGEVDKDFPLTFVGLEMKAETTRPIHEWLSLVTECGGETKKLISRGSFHLKGGGWYKDGY